MSRIRSFLLAALAAAAALALAACGSSDQGASASGAAPSAEPGTFPARATHRFGTTTVPSEPKRIVIVGLTEQDAVLALGYKPLATTEWYGRRPGAIWPWAREAMGAENPTVLSASDGFQFERIAALRPDLIIGTNAGMQRGDYEKLSKIAPTIAGVRGGTDYFSPWEDQTVLIAQALGKEDEGRELVDDVKARYAAVAAEHPEWEGKSATFSQGGFYDGLIYVYPPGLNTEFLSYLGFDINRKLTPLVEKAGEQVTVSPERLDVLDADVAVFATEQPADVAKLLKVPTFGKLPVVSEHRSVYTDGTLAGAIYFMTPLSLPYVLDKLAPQLADAVAGEAPQKVVDTAEAPDGDAHASTSAVAEEDALPVAIAHKYGSTTIERAPKRVVVAGLREQDSLLALGVVPVATTEWYGNHPGGIFPWAKDELGDAPVPAKLDSTDGIPVEKIAAQRPDLILAVYSGLTKKDYETLSKIAPTVAQPRGQVDYGSSWQDEILTVGKAVGRPAAAQRLHDETEALLAEAAAEHPEFEGQTAAVATPYQGIYVYGPQDARSRLLVDLGFTFPKALEKVGGSEFGGELSGEQVSKLDVGTLLWFANPGPAKKLKAHPVYRTLDVRSEGRDVFLAEKGDLYEATSFVSVLSIPLLVDELVPRLAAAADGDPSTSTT